MTKDEALKLALEALNDLTDRAEWHDQAGYDSFQTAAIAITAIKKALGQPEQEPVAVPQFRIQGCSNWYDGYPDYLDGGGTYETRTLYTTPPQLKPLSDEQTIILKDTTCPEIDWKTRHGVEMNNGERNQWMLDWFRAFKVAIEAAHGIKENS